MKPKVSIIILHYQVKSVLFNCLESLKRHQPKVSHEIIVVDNDEKKTLDKILKKKFPQIKYLKSPGNIGYGAGNNLGAKIAQGQYLFILNPDIIISPGSIDKLVSFLQSNKKATAVAPLLTNQKGKPYPFQGTSELTPIKAIFALSFINRLFPNNPLSRGYWLKPSSQGKPQPVETVPGSAFLIRKTAFKKVGQFDENMFLYFEENDLGNRLKNAGYQLYVLPQVKVIHHWAATTPDSPKIKKHFMKSRFYYFKKHYGRLWALIVEFFTRLSPAHLILTLILLLATWLRFYRLPELMTFIGDQGRDYLAARDMLLTGQWALVGIPSSVPWLHQGPFFIWLIALAMKLGQFNPLAPAILTSTLGVLTVYLTYTLSRYWFSKPASLTASLIMATAPLAVIHSRLAYHISPIPLFSLLFIFSVYFWAKKQLQLFWPVLLWAILLQFELTTVPLILLIPLIYLRQKIKPTKKHLFSFILATTIPFLPKLIYDLTHGFKQTLGFVAWLGYRFLSFFGFSGRHTVSLTSLKQATATILTFFRRIIVGGNSRLDLTFIFIILLAVLWYGYKQRPTKKPWLKNLKLSSFILLTYILINLVALYFHQAPSEAYFPVFFPAWVLVTAWIVDSLKKPALMVLFILLSIYNVQYLVSHNFVSASYGPTLKQKLAVTKFIKLQTQDKPFKLINHPSNIHASHLDNYRYLLWWLGSPENPQAKKAYTIYDGPVANFTPPAGVTIYHFDNIKLIKHD